MSLNPLTDTPIVGIQAGWALTFHRERPGIGVDSEPALTLTSQAHYGEIEAVLPGGLEGGRYSFTIEGVSETDHATIAAGVRTGSMPVARLHLFWDDRVDPLGLGGTRSEPVAELVMVHVTLRPGARRYETTITARERVFERLSSPVEKAEQADNPLAALRRAANRADITLEPHDGFDDNGQLVGPVDAKVATVATTFAAGSSYLTEVREIGTAIEQASNRYGRGVLLIRDGKLHAGIRNGGLGDRRPTELTPGTGLVEILPQEASKPTAAGAPGRPRYQILLRGRPDLKPGSVVGFDPPPSEGQRPGTGPTLLYIDSVHHKLGRVSGFVTTVAGVVVEGADTATQIYDSSPLRPRERGAGTEDRSADAATRAAQAIKNRIAADLASLRLIEAAEVRRVTSAGDGSAGQAPRHTTTVWGVTDADGHPNHLARAPVQRVNPAPRERVTRLTPFAWGKTGLVVPRYPGTRIALGHGDGRPADPIDLGAMWPAGDGPDARPGDWWLILPIDAAEPESLPDDDKPPEPHTGKVSQDLIDAAGNRVIEAGELTIRVAKGGLSAAGERPERGVAVDEEGMPAGSVSIEHVDGGSRIVMTDDGTIRIEGKRIEMSADDVVVEVTNNMDVRRKST